MTWLIISHDFANLACNHYKKPVLFVMSPKIVDVLQDINILEKEK